MSDNYKYVIRMAMKNLVKIGFVTLVLLMPSKITLGDVSMQRKALDKAQAEYYKAISNLKNPTAADFKGLKQEIVDPAAKAYSDALKDQYSKNFPYPPMPKHTPHDRATREAQTDDGKIGREKKGKSGTDQKGKRESSGQPSYSGSSDNSPSRDEMVVDGKGVPKEIEFQGKPKKKWQRWTPPPKKR